jgi:hypothetical protein
MSRSNQTDTNLADTIESNSSISRRVTNGKVLHWRFFLASISLGFSSNLLNQIWDPPAPWKYPIINLYKYLLYLIKLLLSSTFSCVIEKKNTFFKESAYEFIFNPWIEMADWWIFLIFIYGKDRGKFWWCIKKTSHQIFALVSYWRNATRLAQSGSVLHSRGCSLLMRKACLGSLLQRSRQPIVRAVTWAHARYTVITRGHRVSDGTPSPQCAFCWCQ